MSALYALLFPLVTLAPSGDLAPLYETARPAVVRIHAGGTSGSGFLVGDGTRVVTAAHVVDAYDSVTIETFGGATAEATLIAWDDEDDLAVLELPSALDGTAVLAIAGPEDQPTVGDTLVAIGHPLLGSDPLEGRRTGLLEWSLTAGLASAVGEHRIQTTASVQPGNSGGPVLDVHGRVVGVVSARHGDFGIAIRTQALAALLALDAPMERTGPVVGGGARLGLAFGWVPNVGQKPGFNFGGSADFYLELDRKLQIGGVVRLQNQTGVQLGDVDKRRRLDVLFRVGARLDLKGAERAGAAVRPYFTAGLQLHRDGRNFSRMQVDDPDCDPFTEECSVSMDQGTDWLNVPGLYVGGGLGVDLGPGFMNFELGTNVLNPADVRFGLTWGINFGKPPRRR